MSPSSSTIGEAFTMPSKLRGLYGPHKPEIKITFSHPKKTYTTLDRLEGTVTVTAPVDTPFDSVDIEFVGTSRTFVERMTTSPGSAGRSEAFHQFLKLSQPGSEQYFPEDLVFRAGKTYEFPFIFAVPQQLLPRVCQHFVHNQGVHDAHLLLPPTFGDRDLDARQKSMDDMAPDMASVRYGIFAKVTEVKMRGDDAHRSTLVSKARRVRVIPAVEEQPPMDERIDNGEYVMRKEKTIRKGMLKGKIGTLVMQAAQPPALQVQSYDNPDARTNTHATIMLRYDPLDDKCQPPKLGNLASRLKVSTYFASTARHGYPVKHSCLVDMTQGLHSEQFNLSSRLMANVEWVKHHPTDSPPAAPERRDSATSMHTVWTGGIPEPSETYKGKHFYTARLLVPVQLPTNKLFVPSFHTCLVSRVYALKFDLNVSTSGIAPSMDLKVPVQISSGGLVGDDLERRESVSGGEDVEMDGEDVENLFEPRTIRAPSEAFIGRSRLGSLAGPAGRGRIGSQAPDVEEGAAIASAAVPVDAPPGYTPPVRGVTGARMTNHRAMSVPVY